MGLERVDKIISTQLNISRKAAKQGIRAGLLEIDGKRAFDAGLIADTERQKVVFDGQAVCYREHVYLILHKPAGILSASNDKKRRTVIDLVPPELCRRGLFPVGRLDKDTTGLLLITDDGDFAHNIISPKKRISKTYIAALDIPVSGEMIEAFEKGAVLADGTVCRPAGLRDMGDNYAEVIITEGKYHQIKRMFGVVGAGVLSLHRESIGSLLLPQDLHQGECRQMTAGELAKLLK